MPRTSPESGVRYVNVSAEQQKFEGMYMIGQVAALRHSVCTARELHERVSKTHDVVFITSLTVANRLVAKGILRREKRDDLFHYSATMTPDEFRERASKHVMQRVVGLGAAAVSASLVDVLAKSEPAQLAELGRLVRRKLKERGDLER